MFKSPSCVFTGLTDRTVFITDNGVFICGEHAVGVHAYEGNKPVHKYSELQKIKFPFGEIKTVACTKYKTFFLTSSGNVYKCGPELKPTQLLLPEKINYMSASHDLAIFVDRYGNGYLCGASYHEFFGYLHDSEFEEHDITSKPLPIKGLKSKIKSVTCGADHSIFELQSGKLVGCGHHTSGQLGKYNKRNKYGFQEVNMFSSCPNAIDITCGGDFTIALLNEEAYGCGLNFCGQLGLGAKKNIKNRICQSTKIEGKASSIKKVLCGYSHTIFITDKEIYGCGENNYGQLGCKKEICRNQTPIIIKELYSGEKIVGGACGVRHTVLVTNKGRFFVSGSNEFGQLGLDCEIKRINKFTLLPGIKARVLVNKSGKSLNKKRIRREKIDAVVVTHW